MKITNLLFSILILNAANAQAEDKPVVDTEEQPTGIVKIHAPDGWQASDKEGVAQGANVVFFPKGGSWSTSPAVFYLRTADKVDNSLVKTIDAELAHYKENAPQVVITDEPGLFTNDGKIAVLKKIKDHKSDNLEIVAFVSEPNSVSVITLNSKTEKEAKKDYPAFKALVNSYSFKPTPGSAKKPMPKESMNTDKPTNNDANITGTNLFTSNPLKNKHEQ